MKNEKNSIASHRDLDDLDFDLGSKRGISPWPHNGPRIDPKFAAFYPFGDFEFLSVNNGGTDTQDGRANLRLSRHNPTTAGFEYPHETIFQPTSPSFRSRNNTTDGRGTPAISVPGPALLLH